LAAQFCVIFDHEAQKFGMEFENFFNFMPIISGIYIYFSLDPHSFS